MRNLTRRLDAIEAKLQAKGYVHRAVEIVDGDDHPWPGPERVPWTGVMPIRIEIIGVEPKEVRHG